MSEFDGKVAIVTGASSGIGRRAAELLAARGARVAIFARSMDKLDAIAARNRERMLAVSGDVADLAAVERLFAATESRFGHCDVLINNAGMIDPGPFIDTTLDEWERMFAVNVRGAFLTCRRALPSMIERRGGAIVNVSSISGVVGPEKSPGWVSYCASKGALISMTEVLAVEVKEHGVRINCVSPGSVDTAMWAEASGGAPAEMSPDEVAEAILFLASERARAMNGQNLPLYSV
ncbi:MAG TPA: SDR family NAD(P)-dependent oxidoreductase [Thermoanaerobaculia bacterium]|nr:SDR family NAD(P)-dependent oxidoreductase [Thermoanaerobaculia bacterium]